jgi:glutathione peroxidase
MPECRIISVMSVINELTGINGDPIDPSVLDGKAVLVVNVASKCGLTPPYDGLERLQEPGTPEEISQFCSATYGATFPLTEKLEVNGQHRHPLYDWLSSSPDASGEAGEVQWNFEKFLVSPAGEVVARFRPQVDPEDDQITSAIERVLPGA